MNHQRLGFHPHIVRFHKVFLTPTHLAIVQEYVPGGDVQERLAYNGRFSEAEARHVFQQLVSALYYCHSMGVANRDVKMENTLLDCGVPPCVKICDFGYSKNILESAACTNVGTSEYLAPELMTAQHSCCRQDTHYNAQAADVWSCGCVLFAMLTARYPFTRQQDAGDPMRWHKMCMRIMNGDYDVDALAAARVSPACCDLLARILVVDPQRRITLPGIVAHPWFRNGMPASVRDTLALAAVPHDPWPLYCWPSDAYGSTADQQSVEEIKRLIQQARYVEKQVQLQAWPGSAYVDKYTDSEDGDD